MEKINKNYTLRKNKLFLLVVIFFVNIFITTSVQAVIINSTTQFLSNGSTLTNGLVGHWTFDGRDMVSGVAKDRSGSGFDGNLINIATSTFYAFGKLGQVFRFDGTNDYTTLTGTSAWAFGTGDFSVSFWMNASVWSAYESPFSNGVYGAGWDGFHFERADFGSGCTPDTANRIVFVPAGPSICSTTTILTNTWYHVVGLRRSGVAYIYINGVQESSGTAAGNVNVARNAMVGRNPDNTYPRYFNGKEDDVRVYNRALTDAEVKQLYKLGGGVINASSDALTKRSSFASGLVDYWSFDGKDVVNGIIKDRGTSAIDGTPLNIATSTFYSMGKLGQSVTFSGSNRVDLPSSITLGHASTWTASTWIKTTGGGDMYFLTNQSGGPVSNALRISSGKINYYHYNGVWNSNSGSVTVNDGKWHHLVWVNSSSATMVMYVDGVADGSSFASDNGGPVNRIGNIWGDTPVSGLIGTMDDLRIYNRVLTDAEVKKLYSMAVSTVQSSSQILTNGSTLRSSLVGLWSFDGKDIVNGVVMDRAGSNNGNTFTIATSTFYVVGKMGQAGNFDGGSDYVNTGAGLDFASATFSSGFTIAAWVNPTITPASKKAIFSSAFGTSGDQWQTYVWYNTDTTFGTAQRSAAAQNDFSGAAHVAGRWYHVTVTWDGTTTRLYVNGVQENSAAGGRPDNQPASREVRIGNFKGYASSEFQGPIDDVRVYSRALSVAEVKQLYILGR
ncbi:MAG: LamG domain-containing protein [Candidatus Taylorbacteria bacterium]|nr:LamG domain-containing protein [Candidatus Taylorbacteria bacterium]